MGESDWQSIVIPSDPTFVTSVQQAVLACARQAGAKGRRLFAVRLVLEEAIANAIKHGNGMDPAKAILTRFRIEDRTMVIEVSDEGDGFDHRQVPDPTDPRFRRRMYGRGIFFMKSYADQVEYNDCGNRVRLAVRLTEDQR